MTDREFCRKVNNRILTRMYNFCCYNEVTKLIRKNGWNKGTPERTKIIEELYDDLKPAFIDFAQSGPDTSEIGNLPSLFSEHLICLGRRKKLEKIRRKMKLNDLNNGQSTDFEDVLIEPTSENETKNNVIGGHHIIKKIGGHYEKF